MDEIVIRGMAKWPNVPVVYGWLSLDRRGQWLLKGEKISNRTVVDFIGRNYEHDERGRWFFQNGPQRVYVTLAYTPLVYRVTRAPDGLFTVESQHGLNASIVRGAWMDEDGALLLQTDLGVGIVHDNDLNVLLDALVDAEGNAINDDSLAERIHRLQQGATADLFVEATSQRVRLHRIDSRGVPARFGFDQCATPRIEGTKDAT